MLIVLSVLYIVLHVSMITIVVFVRLAYTYIKANVSLLVQNIRPYQEAIALISTKKPNVN